MTDYSDQNETWTCLPRSACLHPKDRIEKNGIGYHCLSCWAYIDRDMISDFTAREAEQNNKIRKGFRGYKYEPIIS